MTWSFDMSTAPNDAFIWAASKCGKVIKSNFITAMNRWSGFAAGEQPIAWHPYVIPVHPGARAAVSREINLPIIDDVGGWA